MKLKYLRGTDMSKQMHMEERLWDHIDGLGDAAERAEIERLIATDAAWRSAYDALLDTQRLLKSTELEQPSLRFTKNVMESIARYQVAPPTRSYVNKRIIWAIGGFFGVLLLAGLAYGFSTINFGTGGGSGFKLPTPDLSFLMHVPSSVWTIFLMADAMLGLLFLDRYLRKNKQTA
jgi:hypothetical protein